MFGEVLNDRILLLVNRDPRHPTQDDLSRRPEPTRVSTDRQLLEFVSRLPTADPKRTHTGKHHIIWSSSTTNVPRLSYSRLRRPERTEEPNLNVLWYRRGKVTSSIQCSERGLPFIRGRELLSLFPNTIKNLEFIK